MKNYKNLLFYIITIVGFSAIMFFIIQAGKLEEFSKLTTGIKASIGSWQQFLASSEHNLTNPLAILLLQITTIILVARIFGFIFKKIGQPTVIGEIIAGIFLGPSIMGLFFPHFTSFMFPVNSLPNLQILSQIGLILFMFIVGMELDLDVIRKKAKDAIIVSHSSIIFPFTLGVGLAFFLYKEYAPANTEFLSFALFMGIAMSITAFPVLARIVQERGLTKTKLGSMVITCAAIDDITAWCILAAVIAIVKAGSAVSSVYTIILAVCYVIVMLKFIKPFLHKLGEKYSNKEGLSKPVVAVFFVLLILSSYCTEIIGIHALFGAFMAGVIMPVNKKFRGIFIEKVEDISLVLLLPLFFVFTGLRTQIGLLNELHLWETTGIIIITAVTGKFIGSALTSRFVGQSWRDSLTIGALMNTRGLMELVVLNIGFDLGILSPQIFTMMVLMALITTFMTGPALYLIEKIFSKNIDTNITSKNNSFNVLVSFGNPYAGQKMLRMINCLIDKKYKTNITALHLSPNNDLNLYNEEEFDKESFRPIKNEAQLLNIPINCVFKASQNIEKDIIDTANNGDFNIMIIGIGQSVFNGTIVGKVLGFTTKIINPGYLYNSIFKEQSLFESDNFDERTSFILKSVTKPVGVFIDKNLQNVKNILIPLFSSKDFFLFNYVKMLINNSNIEISLIEDNKIFNSDEFPNEYTNIIENNKVNIYDFEQITNEIIKKQDLIIISSDGWKLIPELQVDWLIDIPSVLIIKK